MNDSLHNGKETDKLVEFSLNQPTLQYEATLNTDESKRARIRSSSENGLLTPTTETTAFRDSSYRGLARTASESSKRKSRRVSIADIANSSTKDLEKLGRRAMYGSLPFAAAFGMGKKEAALRNVLRRASVSAVRKEKPFMQRMDTMTQQKFVAEIDLDQLVVTISLVMSVMVAIISQFLVGYNMSVMNGPAAVVFPGHSTLQWSLATAAFAFGAPFGAIAGGIWADERGRKASILINTWIFFAGGLMMSLAPSVLWLMPARLLIGFASGSSSVVVPVYLGEIAPPTLRGTLGTMTQFAMVIGILASTMLAFPLGTADGWRYLFGVIPLLSLAQAVMFSPYLLESPRWLLTKRPQSDEARDVIKSLRGYRYDHEVEYEVDNYQFAIRKQQHNSSNPNPLLAMWDLLCDGSVRILLVSAVVLQIGQQLCGIGAVFYYSTTFFDGIISNPLMGTLLLGVVNVLGTYIALKLMDTTKRRKLLLASSLGMLISIIVLITALLGYCVKEVTVIALIAYVVFFEIGLGPIPWLIVAEMFDARHVATAMSISCITNWGCNFIVGLAFPFLDEGMGPWSFGPFAVCLMVVIGYVYFRLPETQGRSVEEIQELVSSFERHPLRARSTDNDEENNMDEDDAEEEREEKDLEAMMNLLGQVSLGDIDQSKASWSKGLCGKRPSIESDQ
jgi:SP family facilitated glucose transporter-like MFS transporter 3